jgi:two-component system CheB/CheR fusion protein
MAENTQEEKAIALHYMKTLVDVAREPFLVLDADLRVIFANPVFYETFQVKPVDTEERFIYELGNGQWNIPELKKLLEEILPKEKTVKNYKVTHLFEKIGEKTMLLNAGQIDAVKLIILALEDTSLRRSL